MYVVSMSLSAWVMCVSLSVCMMSGSLDVSVWLLGVRLYVNTPSIKTIRGGGGMAVIVLCFSCEIYHIIHCVLHSLWVMCLVFGFLSGVYRFAGRTDENRVHTLAVISHVTTEKTFVN